MTLECVVEDKTDPADAQRTRPLRNSPFALFLALLAVYGPGAEMKGKSGHQKKSAVAPMRSRKADDVAVAKASKPATGRILFGIEPRSLAVFRGALGILLLLDLVVRLGDLEVMYTDDGMFSRAEICRRASSIWNWSFHFASGTEGYQA